MVQLQLLALLVFVSPSFVVAAPRNVNASACVNRVAHKPWGLLSKNEQSAYIQAELCLMSTPAKTGIPGAVTRWDELQWNHILNAHAVHDVGHFLPWHRYNLAIHGNLLRDECGYTGPLPYWDETADSVLTSVADSPIFQPDAFGGNGNGSEGYITDGPFAQTILRLKGKGQAPADHHIYRKFNTTRLSGASKPALNACFQISTYNAAWECLAGTPHGAGHGAAGGLMMDVQASPGDPVFYLHHGWLDAMWWKWQTLDLPNRLTDMGGRNLPLPSYVQRLGLPYPGREVTDYSGDPGDITTLNHVLANAGIAPNVTVGQVMDVRGDVICAEYIFSDTFNVKMSTGLGGVMTTSVF